MPTYAEDDPTIETLIGQTLTECRKVNDDTILMTTSEGREYRLFHYQDCCEHVYIEDITGDLEDLVGTPILHAEEVDNRDAPPLAEEYGPPESYTWTFYKLASIKGYVTIRFYGTSNGYYSESASFARFA